MRLGKTVSVEELQVVSRFENLRGALLAEEYSDHLDKPLAYWALPADRRLPLALLGRTLGDILNTPFADLSATPGIGRKKISLASAAVGQGRQHRSRRIARRYPQPARRQAVPRRAPWRADAERQRFRSGGRLRGLVGAVAGQRRPSWTDRRDARAFRPQPAKHDPRHLEHPAGRLHELHLGRNPRHEDARRKTGRRHPRGLSRRPHACRPAWAPAITSPCGSFPA